MSTGVISTSAAVAPTAYSLLTQENRTENAFASHVAARNQHQLRYVTQWESFIVYDGKRWAVDEGPMVDRIIRQEAQECWKLVSTSGRVYSGERREIDSFVKHLNSARGKGAIRNLLPSDAGIAIHAEQLDQDPLLLNVQNGVIDLRIGHLKPHAPGLLLSKIAPVEYDFFADCPLWNRFLREIFGDRELIEHVQDVVGYMLSGSVREHKLFILYGTGANGKSTFVEAIMSLLGEYAAPGAPDLLLKKKDSHPTELAALCGKRLVVCNETEEGRRLAEARVKLLTGGDMLSVRRVQEDFWSFSPSHKLVICTNHKPELVGTDYGLRRRLHMIPFLHTIAPDRQDKDLLEKLRGELPGILNWALAGAARWNAMKKLGEPKVVHEATAEYVACEDTIGRFIEEECRTAPGQKVRASVLFEAYRTWCASQGEFPFTQKRLGLAIEERGFKKRISNGTWYDGIGLKST